MQVNILLFGITKDIVGDSKLLLELKENAEVIDLKTKIAADYPKLQGLRSLMIAVNNEYALDNRQLKETDEIALIPPVSGG